MVDFEIPQIDIDALIVKSEKKFKTHVREFTSESGKRLGAVIGGAVPFIIAGGVIPETFYLTIFGFVPILIFGILLYILVGAFARKYDEARQDMIGMAVAQSKTVSVFNSSQKRLYGRIENLESETHHGIVEMDLDTGLLIHNNMQFFAITGWDARNMNEILEPLPIEARMAKFVELAVHPADQIKIMGYLLERQNGKISKRKSKVRSLRKDGDPFHSIIVADLIEDNGQSTIQFFLTDRTDELLKQDEVKGWQNLVNLLQKHFATPHKESATRKELIDHIENMKGNIKHALRR